MPGKTKCFYQSIKKDKRVFSETIKWKTKKSPLSLNEAENTANRNVRVVQKSKVGCCCLSGNKNQCLETRTGEKKKNLWTVSKTINWCISKNEIKGILTGRKRSAGRKDNRIERQIARYRKTGTDIDTCRCFCPGAALMPLRCQKQVFPSETQVKVGIQHNLSQVLEQYGVRSCEVIIAEYVV